jgi:2-dehydropantoate 2-reductase
MREIKTVALIGLGAIGSAFLNTLSKNAPDIRLRVIAGGERLVRYRESGVTINGETVRFETCDSGKPAAEPDDLVIFATKFGSLPQAIEDARGYVGDNTILLSLLNGITSEDIIASAYGRSNPIYSYCVGTDATRHPEGVRFETMFKVPFGQAQNIPGDYSGDVLSVRSFFEKAGIGYEIPEDMQRSRWWKYMLNMGVNQTLAILREPYRALQRDGYARELARSVMLETVAIARAEGIALTPGDTDEAFRVVEQISPDGKPSTLQDIEARRKTEIDIFSGDLLRKGKELGVPLPVNEVLYKAIKAIEEQWSREN